MDSFTDLISKQDEIPEEGEVNADKQGTAAKISSDAEKAPNIAALVGQVREFENRDSGKADDGKTDN